MLRFTKQSLISFLIVQCFILTSHAQVTLQRQKSRTQLVLDDKSVELKKLDSAIVKFQLGKNKKKLGQAYEAKADFLQENELGISSIYYEKSLEAYKKINAEEDYSRVLSYLVSHYTKVNDYKSALKKSYDLLAVHEKNNDSLRIAQSYSGIGSLYDDLNNPKKALEYMLKGLKLAIELKQSVGEAAIRNNLAAVYKDLGKFELAFENVRKAEKLNTVAENNYWLSINYMMYYDLYSELHQMDSARYYLLKSNAYTIKEGDLSDSLDMFRKTGIYYHDIDSMYKAIEMFNEGILVSRKLGSLKSEANFAHWLSEVYERHGKMDLALSFLQIRQDLLDSLAAQESGKRLEEYEVLYEVSALETDLTEKTLQVNRAKNEAQQNRQKMYWLLGVLLVLIIGSSVIFVQYKKQVQTNRHLLELNVKSTENETSNTDKYAQSNLTDSKKQEILSELDALMKVEKLFTDQELKLDNVAKKLNISRTYLSQVINETYDQNFTTYINAFRINLAKKYLISEEHDKYSIQGIAEMVGFKSVSAFNTSFKKITGLAPSYYRKNAKGVK